MVAVGDMMDLLPGMPLSEGAGAAFSIGERATTGSAPRAATFVVKRAGYECRYRARLFSLLPEEYLFFEATVLDQIRPVITEAPNPPQSWVFRQEEVESGRFRVAIVRPDFPTQLRSPFNQIGDVGALMGRLGGLLSRYSGIHHLHLSPDNLLFDSSGHLALTDAGCWAAAMLQPADFLGTREGVYRSFLAPELQQWDWMREELPGESAMTWSLARLTVSALAQLNVFDEPPPQNSAEIEGWRATLRSRHHKLKPEVANCLAAALSAVPQARGGLKELVEAVAALTGGAHPVAQPSSPVVPENVALAPSPITPVLAPVPAPVEALIPAPVTASPPPVLDSPVAGGPAFPPPTSLQPPVAVGSTAASVVLHLRPGASHSVDFPIPAVGPDARSAILYLKDAGKGEARAQYQIPVRLLPVPRLQCSMQVLEYVSSGQYWDLSLRLELHQSPLWFERATLRLEHEIFEPLGDLESQAGPKGRWEKDTEGILTWRLERARLEQVDSAAPFPEESVDIVCLIHGRGRSRPIEVRNRVVIRPRLRLEGPGDSKGDNSVAVAIPCNCSANVVIELAMLPRKYRFEFRSLEVHQVTDHSPVDLAMSDAMEMRPGPDNRLSLEMNLPICQSDISIRLRMAVLGQWHVGGGFPAPTVKREFDAVVRYKKQHCYNGVVGVDYGASNTCVVAWLDDALTPVPCDRKIRERNPAEFRTAIYYPPTRFSEPVLGRPAEEQLITAQPNALGAVKRQLGDSHRIPLITQTPAGEADTPRSAHEVFRQYLETLLKSLARPEELFGPPPIVVVSHPTRMELRQLQCYLLVRRQIEDWLRSQTPRLMARKVLLLDEATCAAIDVARHFEAASTSLEANHALQLFLLDCGGSTTDIAATLFRLHENGFDIETQAADGVSTFGGNNLTVLLMQKVYALLVPDSAKQRRYPVYDDTRTGGPPLLDTDAFAREDLKQQDKRVARENGVRLFSACESFKKELLGVLDESQTITGAAADKARDKLEGVIRGRFRLRATTDETEQDLPELGESELLNAFKKIDLPEFNRECEAQVQRAVDVLASVVKRVPEIDKVTRILVLAGHSSRHPAFRKLIKEHPDLKGLEPQMLPVARAKFCVAAGAYLAGEIVMDDEASLKAIKFTSQRLSYAIGFMSRRGFYPRFQELIGADRMLADEGADPFTLSVGDYACHKWVGPPPISIGSMLLEQMDSVRNQNLVAFSLPERVEEDDEGCLWVDKLGVLRVATRRSGDPKFLRNKELLCPM